MNKVVQLLAVLMGLHCSRRAVASRTIFNHLGVEEVEQQQSTSETAEADLRASLILSPQADRLAPNGTCRNPDHIRYFETYAQMYNTTLQREFWGNGNVQEAEVDRYQVLKIAGAGREGAVAIALDLQTRELVAIKKVLHLFRDASFTQMVRNEIRVMDLLKHSVDMMRLKRIAQPLNWETFDSVFMVLETMEMVMPRGLRKFKHEGVERYIGKERMRRNVFQILRGLHYLHTAGLAYNDMRFHNVMLDMHCNARIIDMGAVTQLQPHSPKNTELLHLPATGDHREFQRDIWMLGDAILVWLGGTRFHLARPEEESKAEKIVNIIGLPNQKILSKFSEKAQGMLRAAAANQTKPRTPLKVQLPQADPGLLDVVRRMVSLNAYAHRPTAKKLLENPYFAGLEEELGAIQDGPEHSGASLQHIPCASAEEARRLISEDIRAAGLDTGPELR